ncbi:MAG: hypothetical protein WC505_06335 [Patescibacteria group bacterium]
MSTSKKTKKSKGIYWAWDDDPHDLYGPFDSPEKALTDAQSNLDSTMCPDADVLVGTVSRRNPPDLPSLKSKTLLLRALADLRAAVALEIFGDYDCDLYEVSSRKEAMQDLRAFLMQWVPRYLRASLATFAQPTRHHVKANKPTPAQQAAEQIRQALQDVYIDVNVLDDTARAAYTALVEPKESTEVKT